MDTRTPEFVTVSSISEVKEDKNDVNYKTFRVREESYLTSFDAQTQKVISILNPAAKETGENQWEESYDSSLNGAPDKFYNAKVGQKLAGAIVSRPVPTYEIGPDDNGEMKSVDSYTCAVFGNTADEAAFELAIIKTFKRKNHPLDGLPEEQIILDAVEDDAAIEELADAEPTEAEEAEETVTK